MIFHNTHADFHYYVIPDSNSFILCDCRFIDEDCS